LSDRVCNEQTGILAVVEKKQFQIPSKKEEHSIAILKPITPQDQQQQQDQQHYQHR
jgi:hypothetical protein